MNENVVNVEPPLTMERVWAAMRRKDFAELRRLVHAHHVLASAADERALDALFALDIAVPFVILMWHLAQADETTPEELVFAIADCVTFNPPLHRKRQAVVVLLNYWLARDGLPLLPLRQ